MDWLIELILKAFFDIHDPVSVVLAIHESISLDKRVSIFGFACNSSQPAFFGHHSMETIRYARKCQRRIEKRSINEDSPCCFERKAGKVDFTTAAELHMSASSIG